ncbi:PadR family transcriptional regulator [Marinimicrobium sp. C2-29]|uniref:PadR family transcriptional regulator n=1 Tax=Marinimicrobium sp. C2-29 TaxID=3139825 RepID=UPI00313A1763
MSLRYALLSCLNESPATGYDLTQTLKERMGNVWNSSHQQTYRELSKLLGEACVTFEDVHQSGKPDAKVYSITAQGKEILKEWVNTPSPRPKTRDPLLLKLFAGEFWEDDNALEELSVHRNHWRATLEKYLAIEARYFSEPDGLPRHYRLQYLALKRGIQVNRSWLSWSEELMDVLGSSTKPL